MKKIILVSFIFLFFGLAPHVFAQGFTALAPIPGLTSSDVMSVVNSTTLANFFNNLYKYLIGLAAALAVIEIIWGGLEISTKDSVSKQSDGKARIYQAILGLVLVLSPVLVFSIINPSILNLSLNLQPLNTTSGTSTGTQTTGTGSNQPSTQNTCNGITYTQFKTVPIPTNQYCANVVGSGWVNVDSSCARNSQVDSACAGTNPPSNCQVCGLPATDQNTTACTSVTGTAGVLQIATCPSDAAAQKWGQNCTGNLSSPIVITKNSAQVATNEIIMCAGSQPYVFIDTRTYSLTSPIGNSTYTGLQPVASTPNNPNNGNNAILFASICRSAVSGGDTCLSDLPTFTFAVTCPPTTTNIPSSATGKCYSETLTCTDSAMSSSILNYLSKCASTPNWVIFN